MFLKQNDMRGSQPGTAYDQQAGLVELRSLQPVLLTT